MKNKRMYIVLAIVIILLIPVVLQAPWTVSDYIVAAVLLGITGLAFDVVTSTVKDPTKRLVGGAIVLGLAVYLWAELAVGIFTSWGS